MRAIALAAVTVGVTALLPMSATSAAPRVGPPLDVSIQVSLIDLPDGTTDTPTEATLFIAGRQCLPQDAPASVLVTVDQFGDKVFTATPDDRGRWSLDITIPYPVQTTYVINAECDNYFGTTVYPEATAGPDDVIIAVAEPGVSQPPLAETGSRTTNEVLLGIALLLLGALLVRIGRPQPVARRVKVRS
jgi:hypothetical protein